MSSVPIESQAELLLAALQSQSAYIEVGEFAIRHDQIPFGLCGDTTILAWLATKYGAFGQTVHTEAFDTLAEAIAHATAETAQPTEPEKTP